METLFSAGGELGRRESFLNLRAENGMIGAFVREGGQRHLGVQSFPTSEQFGGVSDMACCQNQSGSGRQAGKEERPAAGTLNGRQALR